MQISSYLPRLTGIAIVALATLGCGGGETTVRPFVKRAGDSKSPAEKADEQAKSPVETDGKT
jgi:hypothetical protein